MRNLNKSFVVFLTVTIFLMFESLFADNPDDLPGSIKSAVAGYTLSKGAGKADFWVAMLDNKTPPQSFLISSSSEDLINTFTQLNNRLTNN